jgi:DNA-binding GntR family transcriptional regulator
MAPRKGRNLSNDARFAEVVDELAGGYRTIGQMVYAVLKEAIINGTFAPGEWLRQESLAEAIGVSRIPVRTALLQLESEGLVNFHPHRGARVCTLSPAQINEIYRLRTLLESYALRMSMTRMNPERTAALRELAAKLDEEHEGNEFLDVRVQFYRLLYDAENNPLLVDMIEDLRGHVGRYLLGFRFSGNHKRLHSDLVECVARGDLPSAEAWLYSHLEGVRLGIEAILRDEEEADAGSEGTEGEDSAADIDSALAVAAKAPTARKPPAAANAPTQPRAGRRSKAESGQKS